MRMTYLANHICSIGYRGLRIKFYTILQDTRPSDDHLVNSTKHPDDCTDNLDDFDVSHNLRIPKNLNKRHKINWEEKKNNISDNRDGIITRNTPIYTWNYGLVPAGCSTYHHVYYNSLLVLYLLGTFIYVMASKWVTEILYSIF